MKPIYAIALTFTLLVINGCSENKTASEADKKDHVLRGQIDTMRDAQNVTKTLNESIKAQDEQATQIAGH